MNDSILRIASFTYPPYHVLYERDGHRAVSGMYGKILQVLSKSLGFSYSITDAAAWGIKINNTWNGAIGLLDRDEADLALCGTIPTAEKLVVAAPTPMINPIEIIIFAGRETRFSKDPFAVLRQLHYDVWMALALGILFVSSLLTASQILLTRTPTSAEACLRNIFLLFGATWNECSGEPPRLNTARMFWITWILGISVILMNAYAGQLKGAMLFKPEKPRLNKLWDLHQRPHLKVYVPENSVEFILKISDKSFVRQLYSRIVEQHKTTRPAATLFSPDILSSVLSTSAAVIASRPACARAAAEKCKTSPIGELYAGTEIVYSFNAVLFLNRKMQDSKRALINLSIRRLNEAGLLLSWFREVAGAWTGCLGTAVPDGHQLQSLHVAEIEGICYIGLIGHSLALIAFVVERIGIRRRPMLMTTGSIKKNYDS
ncbi:glutamate receptor-like [Galendromus occidentalis]|uniref:Glutamate receptor-like n=1 Tax=Galendromus occidentalis TaxID=34638 RepID=A0AAJ6QMH4_9ACAR|nr:glutamate receptor-like [Galendromus occidentalis]